MQYYAVTKAALLAGKHVYSEKPLGASWEEGVELVKLAEERGLMIGGAPDTFLGAGIQTCRRLIDEGAIGQVVGATAFMMSRGPEGWHPDPEFFLSRILDMVYSSNYFAAGFFSAPRMVKIPPLAPGTAPLTNRTLSSAMTRTILRF